MITALFFLVFLTPFALTGILLKLSNSSGSATRSEKDILEEMATYQRINLIKDWNNGQ